jgi:hypothetical protein
MKYKKPEFQQRDTRAFVAIGYNDACINFHVQFHKSDFDILTASIKDVTEYNVFQGAKVAAAFEKIKGLLHKATFGREGSPVLYLHLEDVKWDGNTYLPKSLEETRKEVAAIKKAFSSTKPDEFMLMNEAHTDTVSTVRLWWD